MRIITFISLLYFIPTLKILSLFAANKTIFQNLWEDLLEFQKRHRYSTKVDSSLSANKNPGNYGMNLQTDKFFNRRNSENSQSLEGIK